VDAPAPPLVESLEQVFPVGASVTLDDLEADPHPVLARLRESEPVSWIPALNGWLVTSRELALRVMREPFLYTVDDERFSTGRVVGPSMLTRDGEEHARHRDPFAAPLRLAAVRSRFSPLVEAEVDALIDEFEPLGHTELRRGLAGPLAARVVAHLLGLETADTGAMLGWYDAIVASVTGVAAGTSPSEEGSAAFQALHDAVEPSLDIGGDLSRDEAVSNAAVMLFGGIETTEGMIANLVFHLLANGEDEVEPNAVEESLRLEPAAAVVDRYATQDVEIAGAPIKTGDLVEVSLAGANRDPAFFPDPDRFDVHRENARHHLTFAHGPHVCIGMHLARLEALTAARRLFERLPGLRFDPDRPTAPRGLVFRKPPRLDVLWDAA
jgi:cytochrome P450